MNPRDAFILMIILFAITLAVIIALCVMVARERVRNNELEHKIKDYKDTIDTLTRETGESPVILEWNRLRNIDGIRSTLLKHGIDVVMIYRHERIPD